MTIENNIIEFPKNARLGFDRVYSILQDQPEMLFSSDLDFMIEREIIRGRGLECLKKLNKKIEKKVDRNQSSKTISLIEKYEDKLYDYYIGNSENVERKKKQLLTRLLIIYDSGLSKMYAAALDALEG